MNTGDSGIRLASSVLKPWPLSSSEMSPRLPLDTGLSSGTADSQLLNLCPSPMGCQKGGPTQDHKNRPGE